MGPPVMLFGITYFYKLLYFLILLAGLKERWLKIKNRLNLKNCPETTQTPHPSLKKFK